MITKDQINVIEKYIPSGIIKGGELLLSRDLVISFIDELAVVGVLINGCDLWRYLDSDRNPKRIVALLGDGILVHDGGPFANTTEVNAKIVREYIEKRLPEDADLVSIIYEDGEIYDYLREKSH